MGVPVYKTLLLKLQNHCMSCFKSSPPYLNSFDVTANVRACSYNLQHVIHQNTLERLVSVLINPQVLAYPAFGALVSYTPVHQKKGLVQFSSNNKVEDLQNEITDSAAGISST